MINVFIHHHIKDEDEELGSQDYMNVCPDKYEEDDINVLHLGDDVDYKWSDSN